LIRKRPHIENAQLVEAVDAARDRAYGLLSGNHRSEHGQYGTPTPVARLMASMFNERQGELRLLDAGAGVGSLTAAFVDEVSRWSKQPAALHVVAYEIEELLVDALRETLLRCEAHCGEHGITFTYEIRQTNFLREAQARGNADRFDFAIQNPPYRKIRSNSDERGWLREIGVEVSNLYAAFVALATRMMAPGGELVAITPRSFCNGPYFKSFREDFLRRMRLLRIHVFESRRKAFRGDSVLQENVVFHSEASHDANGNVCISSSTGEPGDDVKRKDVPYSWVVPRQSSVPFIHLITDEDAETVADRMKRFGSTLEDIGLRASTGRIVDFRAREFLREDAESKDAPLIYPMHLRNAAVQWPRPGAKKPNGITIEDRTQSLLVPAGIYVLVKRFSAKEQRRRIEASIYDADEVRPGSPVGFENHLNYVHENGGGLEPLLATGLVLYLNSTLVDRYFRLFSGHTQVNATDLNNLPFPSREELVRLARAAGTASLSQSDLKV
jgi:adenine-specific DNA-methyltransferase